MNTVVVKSRKINETKQNIIVTFTNSVNDAGVANTLIDRWIENANKINNYFVGYSNIGEIVSKNSIRYFTDEENNNGLQANVIVTVLETTTGERTIFEAKATSPENIAQNVISSYNQLTGKTETAYMSLYVASIIINLCGTEDII